MRPLLVMYDFIYTCMDTCTINPQTVLKHTTSDLLTHPRLFVLVPVMFTCKIYFLKKEYISNDVCIFKKTQHAVDIVRVFQVEEI